MKITALEVDGYGVWNGLKMDGMSQGLNVFYGPNEAGKTTLMQFVRSILYGFSPQRRRYLPPVHGGRPGGSINVAGPNGRFLVSRYHEENTDNANGQLTLSAADGTRQGEHFLKVLLCNIDEAIFNNVFAVGLRELQELGTLSDTEAASLLYNLSAGLDRVSLVEVMQELTNSRNRILDCDGRPCQVVQLLAEREKLRGEIDDLNKATNRHGHLSAQRDRLQREVNRLEEEGKRLQFDARVTEIAARVNDRWRRRTAIDDQLAALGPAATMPEGAVERLDAVNARLQKHQQRADELQGRRRQLRAQAAELQINEALWRQAGRIEALGEQEGWIGSLEDQIAALGAECTELETELADRQRRLGINADSPMLPSVSPRRLSALREPARAIRQCRMKLKDAEEELAAGRENARALTHQIETSLAARGRQELAGAIEQASAVASQLRHRVQVDERLDQMGRYQGELEEQSRELLDRQVLPVGVLLALGSVFIVGAIMMMPMIAGFFAPTSITGWVGVALAVLGLAGAAAAGATKLLLERSNTTQLEACHKQIKMLQLQIKQAKDERENLDKQLPHGGGPIINRLQEADAELASLEELLPLDARRRTAEQEAEAIVHRVAAARHDLDTAKDRWRQALAGVGLPTGLSPKQVRQLARHSGQLDEMQRRLGHRREELQQRRRELEALTGRIAQLAEDTAVSRRGDDPLGQLHALAEELGQQEALFQRRRALRTQSRQFRRKRLKHNAMIGRLKSHRRELLREAGTEDEQEFRRSALQQARGQTLRDERDALTREITAAVAGHCPEEDVGRQIEANTNDSLETRWGELSERLETAQTRLRESFEKRGRLNEQIKALVDDRRLPAKHLELATVQTRLDEAIRRWQVLAVTDHTMNVIRETYEKERQPETLLEASGYLKSLTQGRYTRVWTPLGEDVLLVDGQEEESLPVEVLSRGTREQLFLSLRLALAGCYARRGAQLPLVLDDVLVNFDGKRAKAAAAVLRDFAAAGHQLLVFTCHEHILKLFKSLRVPVNCLPDNAESDVVITAQQETISTSRRKRAVEPEELPGELVAESDDQRPDDEILAVDDDAEEIEADEEELAESADDSLWDDDESDEPEEAADDEEEEDQSDEPDDEDYEEDIDEEEEEEDDFEWQEADDYDDEPGTAEAA